MPMLNCVTAASVQNKKEEQWSSGMELEHVGKVIFWWYGTNTTSKVGTFT